jgi:hypothetical protein
LLAPAIPAKAQPASKARDRQPRTTDKNSTYSL